METNLDQSPFFQLLTNPAPRYRVARHALLWSTVLFFVYWGFQYIARTIPDPLAQRTYANLSTLFFGGLTILAYVIITWLTRKYVLLRFRFWLFTGSLFLVHVLISLIVRWHFLFFTRYLTLPNLPRIYSTNADHVARLSCWQVPFDAVIVWLFSFSLLYNYVLYTVGFKVFKDLFSLRTKQIKLERENLQLELNFLKAQVHPHFLFNTLNNIYSFSIKSPDKVPNMILKLADLMRYSLYETETEFVLLAKELQFLDSYVQLQRVRHEESTALTYTVRGRPGVLMIPPFLLIVFVENAFKHGVQASVQGGWVHIDLTIEDHSLRFTIKNDVPVKRMNAVGGIGLKNVRKRLDFFYPNGYQLNVDEQANEFGVDLIIHLHGPDL